MQFNRLNQSSRLCPRQQRAKDIGVRQLRFSFPKLFRYGLSNHLHWLSNDKAGGHAKWYFLDSQEMNSAYAAALAKIGKCDTVIGSFSQQI